VSIKLTILGSSGALPAYGRFPTSQYLVIQNRHFLIDCGEGAQMQLIRYQIPIHKISCIFISHLHGDHYLGLMGLLFSMHLQRRVSDLHLYSPRGLDEIILLQLKHSKSVLNYEIHFHPFNPDEVALIHEDAALTIQTIPLIHKLPCAGFLFQEKKKPVKLNKEKLIPGMLLQHLAKLKTGADVYDDTGKLLYLAINFTLAPTPTYSYAYCSDTAWNEKMIEQIRDVSLLYHEATFMEEERSKAHETKHSTATEAATLAKRCNAGRLLVGHFSARYRELEPLLLEAQAIFANTDLAIEGKSFELPYESNP
jgi:ribonuclease Z